LQRERLIYRKIKKKTKGHNKVNSLGEEQPCAGNRLAAFYFAGTPFELYDDDDMDSEDPNLNGDDGDPVQRPDTDLMEDSDVPCTDVFNANNCNVLVNAYVRPTYDLTGENVGSFNANVDDGLIASYRNSYFQNQSTEASESFWTVYFLGAYQYTTLLDGDPPDATMYGLTDGVAANDGEGSVIFNEENRDHEYASLDDYNPFPTWRTRPVNRRFTMAHEAGHLFGGTHQDYTPFTTDSGLMTQGDKIIHPIFTTVTINKIRGGTGILHP
jgi:hypothetical protein